MPSLGLLTLGGLRPAHWEITYLEVRDIADLDGLPGSFDLVATFSFTAQIRQAYTSADRFRVAGATVVLGDLHVSALPQEAKPYADSIGEAEPLWPTLLADFERNALQPMYRSSGAQVNLAEAPLPRFELLDIAKYNRLTVQTQRGCPSRCEFCASSIRIAPQFGDPPGANLRGWIAAAKRCTVYLRWSLAVSVSVVLSEPWESAPPRNALSSRPTSGRRRTF